MGRMATGLSGKDETSANGKSRASLMHRTSVEMVDRIRTIGAQIFAAFLRLMGPPALYQVSRALFQKRSGGEEPCNSPRRDPENLSNGRLQEMRRKETWLTQRRIS